MQMRPLLVVLPAVYLCICTEARAVEPWATQVEFQPLKQFSTVRIPNGEEPVSRTVEFPAVRKKPGRRVVLRLRARMANPRLAGWNYYLGLKLNGVQLCSLTHTGTPRLINRKAEVVLDEGRGPYRWPWWGKARGGPESLLIYFAPDGKAVDKRVKSDRGELNWYVVDISDLVNCRMTGLDDVVVKDEPNRLVLTNSLRREFVRGARYDLVVQNLAVATLSTKTWQKRMEAFMGTPAKLVKVAAMKGDGFTLEIGRSGAICVVKNGDRFFMESLFSYPAAKIGYNGLSSKPRESQHPKWQPAVRQETGKIIVTAACPYYSFMRTIEIRGAKFKVRDTFTNTGTRPVGILVKHTLSVPRPFQTCLLAGVPQVTVALAPENPSVFVATDKAGLGLLVEDNVFRLQFRASQQPTRADFKAERFGIDAAKSYTFEWTVYPLDKEADYWTFINRVRKDWNINYTIRGPWDFFNVQRQADLLKDPNTLRAYLKRKHLGIVALVPWLDYDNMNQQTGQLATRAEYKAMMQRAVKVFREADPDMLVTGCMESFPVPLSLEDAKTIRALLPAHKRKQGYPEITAEMLKHVKGIDPRRMDCVFRLPDGRYRMELWYRAAFLGAEKTAVLAALAAYPAVGNAQHEFLMDQARFLIEEVGLDGIYIDCFSLAFGQGLAHSFDKWDGHTVAIDADTGRIRRRYTDAALVGATSREQLIRYVLKAGKVLVANTYTVCKETQSLPAFRFSESEYCFNPLKLKVAQKPPLFARMCGGHLSTPIGLGYRPIRLKPHGKGNEARIVMKTLVTYLRHGGLAYYYYTEIPKEGPGSGEFGPYNHMYPITPVKLGEGFIIGKERIITAISGTYPWNHEEKPEALVFDMTGRPKDAQAEIKKTGNGWSVKLTIQDWENIAVIE